ncbi:recombinase family protein [Streptomyces sp. NPDC004752]
MSTKGQLLDRQIHALTEAGCIRIFADKKSGKNAEREELWKALDFLREGDTLVVPSLYRLGRSIQDLIAIVSGLRKRGIGFTSLREALDTTTPGGRLVFHVCGTRGSFFGTFSEIVRRGWDRPGLMWCRNGFQPPRRPGGCRVVRRSPTSTPCRSWWA